MRFYRAFGNSIASSIPLPLVEIQQRTSPDLVFTVEYDQIDFSDTDFTGFEKKNSAGHSFGDRSPVAYFYDSRRVVLYPGEACYTITLGQPVSIHCRVSSGTVLDIVADTFVDDIVSLVTLMQGGIALHAGCVEVNGFRLCIFGDSGFGKSTTVTSLTRLGCDFLSDDVTIGRIVNDQFEVHSSFPYVRLWDSSADRVIPNYEGISIAGKPGKKRYCVTDWTSEKQTWRRLDSAYLMRPFPSLEADSVTNGSKMGMYITLIKSIMMGFALTAREWKIAQQTCYHISSWTRLHLVSYAIKIERTEKVAELIMRHVAHTQTESNNTRGSHEFCLRSV